MDAWVDWKQWSVLASAGRADGDRMAGIHTAAMRRMRNMMRRIGHPFSLCDSEACFPAVRTLTMAKVCRGQEGRHRVSGTICPQHVARRACAVRHIKGDAERA